MRSTTANWSQELVNMESNRWNKSVGVGYIYEEKKRKVTRENHHAIQKKKRSQWIYEADLHKAEKS